MQQKLFDDLPSDLGVFPHQYELTNDQVLLVRLAPDVLASASFLDQRVLAPNTPGAWFTWNHVSRASLSAARPNYIFHMGHCGSTLMSRLVSAASGSAALREPLPLRILATDAAEGEGSLLGPEKRKERLAFFEACWARGPAPVVVKATSMCTDLAADIVAAGQRALFLYQTPSVHLAALLAGQNTLIDLRGFAQMRHRRLSRHMDAAPLATASLGELAAQVWLSEAAGAASVVGDGFDAINFENFLATPRESLATACDFFGLQTSPEKIAAALSGPIMKTYSKAPEHAFTAETRKQILAEATRNHKDEISRGLAYIEAAGQQSEKLAKAIERFSV